MRLCALASLVLASSAAAQAPYSTSLTESAGGSVVSVAPVRKSGLYRSWNQTDTAGVTRAYYFSFEFGLPNQYVIPTLGGPSSEARAMGEGNGDDPLVVGTSRTSAANSDSQAFYFDRDNAFYSTALPTLGGTYSVANDVTSANWICGASRDVSGTLLPVIWNPNSVPPNLVPLSLGPGATEGEALDFDANNLAVAGWVRDATGEVRACYWPEQGGTGNFGAPQMLTPPGYGESKCYAIRYVPPQVHAEVHAVGYARPASGAATTVAFEYDDGVFHDLGTLGGSDAVLYDSPWKGLAVGTSRDATGNWRAVMVINGQMLDLNGLIDPASGWILESARTSLIPGPMYCHGTLNGVDASCLVSPAGPHSYCTAGTSSGGCTPAMQYQGQPTGSGFASFIVKAVNVDGQRSGLLFYGISARNAAPWGSTSSWLCVEPPLQRMTLSSTGGTSGTCSGVLTENFGAYMTSQPSALGHPLQIGEVFRAQGWYRDPLSAKTSGLTNALEFTLQ